MLLLSFKYLVLSAPTHVHLVFNKLHTYVQYVAYPLIAGAHLQLHNISTLTVVNVSRNGRGALYKPLKLLTLKTRKIQLNRPFKVLHSHHLPTDMRYLHW